MMSSIASRGSESAAAIVSTPTGPPPNLSGPGNLTKGLGITLKDNGVDLTDGEIYFLQGPRRKVTVQVAKRIGVDYAGPWKDELLRFMDAASAAVSGKRLANI